MHVGELAAPTATKNGFVNLCVWCPETSHPGCIYCVFVCVSVFKCLCILFKCTENEVNSFKLHHRNGFFSLSEYPLEGDDLSL